MSKSAEEEWQIKHLQRELEKERAEARGLEGDVRDLTRMAIKKIDEIEELRAEIARLRDPSNWEREWSNGKPAYGVTIRYVGPDPEEESDG